MNKAEILIAVLSKLKEVIDPETGVDVIRMQLVQDLNLDDDGNLTYTFRPSSPYANSHFIFSVVFQEAIKKESRNCYKDSVGYYIRGGMLQRNS